MTRTRIRRYALRLALLILLFFVYRFLLRATTYAAIQSDRPSLVSLCFRLGENIRNDLRGHDSGETWLMVAAREDKAAALQQLLDLGAPIDAQRFEGATALSEAVLADRFGAAKLLVERGADVNLATGFGVTPLMYAAFNGNAELVRLLIAHGAKVEARDNMNMPVRAYARKGRNADVIAQVAARLGVSVEYIHAHKGSK